MLRRPIIPTECGHNAHMYYILLNNLDERTRLIKFLKERDIHPVFHYVPLHNAPKGVEICGGKGPSLPITEEYADRLLRLPCYYELTLDQIWHICETIAQFFDK